MKRILWLFAALCALSMGQGCPGPTGFGTSGDPARNPKSPIPEGTYFGTTATRARIYVNGILVTEQFYDDVETLLVGSDGYPLIDNNMPYYVGYTKSTSTVLGDETGMITAINTTSTGVSIQAQIDILFKYSSGLTIPQSGGGVDTYILNDDGTLSYIGALNLVGQINTDFVSETISILGRLVRQ